MFKWHLANMKRLTSAQHKLDLDRVGWRSDEAKRFVPTVRGRLSFPRHTVDIRQRIMDHHLAKWEDKTRN